MTRLINLLKLNRFLSTFIKKINTYKITRNIFSILWIVQEIVSTIQKRSEASAGGIVTLWYLIEFHRGIIFRFRL